MCVCIIILIYMLCKIITYSIHLIIKILAYLKKDYYTYFDYNVLVDLRCRNVEVDQKLNDGKKMNSAYDRDVFWLQKFSKKRCKCTFKII